MRDRAGGRRRRAWESTRIAPIALLVASCACCPADPDAPLPAPTAVERCADEALRAGRPAEARAAFFQAMRGQERPFLAWIGVARASVAMGDLATADLAVAQAIQVDPGSAASTDLVGRTVLMIARDRGEAGRSQALMADAILSRAERLDPELPNVAYHRGLAHLAADDPRGAVILLERATATDPANQDVRAALVLAYKRVGARVGDGPASR